LDIEEISWVEKEKIRHEVNTFYSKYKGKSIIAHPSVGMDNKYYIYYILNKGFDDYLLLTRSSNLF